MTKTEIYNKMKQAYYTLDIEAVQARIWAHHALNDWIEGITTDWAEIAERKETESQGVFNAMTHILPNWVNYEIDDDSMALVDKLSELKAELKQLTTLEEVA
jgi:hypothetical protein